MQKQQAKKQFTIKYLSRTALLLALALVFQIGFSQFAQPVVGPLVNMTLFLATITVGTMYAIIVGSLTPLIAFMIGIMPLFPVVFFIMIGNIILVTLFSLVQKFSKTNKDIIKQSIGVICGAVGKFVFLAISVRYFVTLFIEQVPPHLVEMLTLPQLYTALIGGALALFIAKRIQPYLNKIK
ncbi:ECF transporter S component [Proteinivorax hydrogeniformans]|uniref:ECF transporter S component n=1 Tax=Proteinivorax hydrogeniformans TaxID=1826727 RepID=A0AAU8HU96_9FIRM